MGAITIRNIDENLKNRLRLEAALHGHSMEEEVRSILRRNLMPPAPDKKLGTRILNRFNKIGGIKLDLPKRHDKPRSIDF